MPAKDYQYPNRVLESALRARDIPVQLLWEIRGPKNTGIAWMAGYRVQASVVIVQTFKEGQGWDAYTPCQSREVEATVKDVIARTAKPDQADHKNTI